MFLIWLDDAFDLLYPLGHVFAGVADKVNLGVFIFRVVSLGPTEVHTERHLVVEVLSYSLLYIA